MGWYHTVPSRPSERSHVREITCNEDSMAKRGGKAASRKSRQRKAQRPQPPQQASRPSAGPPPDVEELTAADVTPSTDAFEKADAELRASAPPPGSRAESGVRAPARARPQPRDFSSSASGPSRLSERAVAEYHYVGRDLRNIGVLTVVLAVLLAISAVVVNLLGIGTA
jgi:hypothetical protein